MKYKLGQRVVTSGGVTGEIIAKRVTEEQPTIFNHRDNTFNEYLVGRLEDHNGVWVDEVNITYVVSNVQLNLWK